jgi:hypothetical protein
MECSNNAGETTYDVQAVKDRFERFQDAALEIMYQKKRLTEFERNMYSISSPRIDGMPKNPSKSNDKMDELLIKKMKLEDYIMELEESHRTEEDKLTCLIKKIPKADERAALTTRFIDGKSPGEACCQMYCEEHPNYFDKEESYRKRFYELTKRALVSMAKVAASSCDDIVEFQPSSEE